MKATKQQPEERPAFGLPGGKAPKVVVIVNTFRGEPEEVLKGMEADDAGRNAGMRVINPLKEEDVC